MTYQRFCSSLFQFAELGCQLPHLFHISKTPNTNEGNHSVYAKSYSLLCAR